MTRWLVEIRALSGEERLLRDLLAHFAVSLTDDPRGRYMSGQRFEALESPQEVRAEAATVIKNIERPGASEASIRVRVELGSVFENVNGESRRMHAFADVALAGRITLSLSAVGTLTADSSSEEERERIALERAEREYQGRLKRARVLMISALNHKHAIDVQHLLEGELSPLNMGHIAALIKADNGALKQLAPSRRQLERFEHSINHPAVYGKRARHIVSSNQPPSKPMLEDEARAFIRDIAHRWLEQKAGVGKSKP